MPDGPPLRPLRPDDPVELGGHRILGRLGEGNQGVVYLGLAPSGDRVAIKVLRARMAEDPGAHERFVRELSAAKKVARFCTAQVLAADVDDDRPYIVSEYVEGRSLRSHILEEGPRTGGALERLAIGTLTALAAIHRAGVVHRDFTPHNVLLGPDGPRVIDFGIARALGAVRNDETNSVGTPSYMAPEQVAGREIGPPADMFAWASTMLFAATGHPPFGNESVHAVMERILTFEPDVSALEEPLRSVVAACLAKDPAKRPTAQQAQAGLLGEEATEALMPPPTFGAARRPATPPEPPSNTEPADQPRQAGPGSAPEPGGPVGTVGPSGRPPVDKAGPAGGAGQGGQMGPSGQAGASGPPSPVGQFGPLGGGIDFHSPVTPTMAAMVGTDPPADRRAEPGAENRGTRHETSGEPAPAAAGDGPPTGRSTAQNPTVRIPAAPPVVPAPGPRQPGTGPLAAGPPGPPTPAPAPGPPTPGPLTSGPPALGPGGGSVLTPASGALSPRAAGGRRRVQWAVVAGAAVVVAGAAVAVPLWPDGGDAATASKARAAADVTATPTPSPTSVAPTTPEPQLNGVRSGIPRPAKTKRPPRACRDYQHVYTMIGTGTVFLHVSVCRDAFSGTAVLADSAPKDGWDVCVQLRGHLTGPGPATYLSTLPMTSRNGNAHGFQNGPTVKFGPKTTKTEDSVTVNTGRCRGSGSKVQTSWQNQERLVTG